MLTITNVAVQVYNYALLGTAGFVNCCKNVLFSLFSCPLPAPPLPPLPPFLILLLLSCGKLSQWVRAEPGCQTCCIICQTLQYTHYCALNSPECHVLTL